MAGLSFHIRESCREDFERLWQIDQQCFPPEISYSRLELAVYMRRSGSFTLIAETSANGLPRSESKLSSSPARRDILGFIVTQAQRGHGHIITIDVLQSARRSGVGSGLLHSAEERLRIGGCGQVHLETAVDNAPALSFYKRHGYYIFKTAPRYYSNGTDAFILKKDLLQPRSADTLPA